MTVAEPDVRPMELPLLPDDLGAGAGDEPDLDEGAGARLIGFAAGHREGCAAGRAEGFAAGVEEGRAAALAEAAERAEQLAGAVADALAEQRSRWDADAERVADAVTDLAMAVAAAVLDREVSSVDDAALDAVRRALRVLPDTTDATGAVLHLHPDDAEAFAGHPALPDVRVVADPDVGPGGCRLHVRDTDVDAGIAIALERVREVLTS
ncbi:FliH/SctL family protein [Dermatobacter hominis]|uniref:FliH/SctL family protein n=1 Tax=Dermatobacter hominis TaxID=2884263 RepID=UPI001D11434E|nr:FliH/SctL family protein [Dermatobacter hominis]UDY37181.1 hypothetical protein LH044_06480 [Dermatobacter hominis]